MTKSVKLYFLFFILFGFYLTALAQQKSSELKKLSKEADVILMGKVVQKKSTWNDSKTKIYTKTTLNVDEYLKGGENSKSIDITYLGGEVGEVGEIYSHMPSFEEREQVIVFLKKDKKNNSYKVINGDQGKISVLNNPKTKSKVSRSKVKSIISQIKVYLNTH